jgi:hypothetical protein
LDEAAKFPELVSFEYTHSARSDAPVTSFGLSESVILNQGDENKLLAWAGAEEAGPG